MPRQALGNSRVKIAIYKIDTNIMQKLECKDDTISANSILGECNEDETAFAANTVNVHAGIQDWEGDRVKLRDIAKAFNIGVTWNGETKTVEIDTNSGYVDE